jgi:hypothetical protein
MNFLLNIFFEIPNQIWLFSKISFLKKQHCLQEKHFVRIIYLKEKISTFVIRKSVNSPQRGSLSKVSQR